MPFMKKVILLTVRIDEVMHELICREAEKDERAISWMARKLLDEALRARELLKSAKQ